MRAAFARNERRSTTDLTEEAHREANKRGHSVRLPQVEMAAVSCRGAGDRHVKSQQPPSKFTHVKKERVKDRCRRGGKKRCVENVERMTKESGLGAGEARNSIRKAHAPCGSDAQPAQRCATRPRFGRERFLWTGSAISKARVETRASKAYACECRVCSRCQ